MATKSRRSPPGQAGRSGSIGRPRQARRPGQPGSAGRRPRHAPYQAEIATLAETTAELPSPFRERAIRIVAAIVGLFERAWRELMRQRPAKSGVSEASGSTDDGGPANRG